MPRRFMQVDVFSAMPYGGNPVAVVLDSDDLTTEDMARFARWTNLSETTFVLPPTRPDADYRVRIFTSASPTDARAGHASELPFAGHPTLGTCHAWLAAGGQPREDGTIAQECGAGVIPVKRTDARLAFAAPPLIRSGPVEGALVERIARMLGIAATEIVDAAWVDNGPGWVGVLLGSADAVLALEPRDVDIDLGVAGPHAPGAPEALEVRAFFPRDGATVEDPVTGSLNASLAEWLVRAGRLATPYVARQGTALGRAGRVHLTQDGDGTLWIGGATATCIDGTVAL